MMHVAYRLIDAACVRKLITKFGGRATRLLSGRRAFRYLVRYKWPQRRGKYMYHVCAHVGIGKPFKPCIRLTCRH